MRISRASGLVTCDNCPHPIAYRVGNDKANVGLFLCETCATELLALKLPKPTYVSVQHGDGHWNVLHTPSGQLVVWGLPDSHGTFVAKEQDYADDLAATLNRVEGI